MRRLITFIFLIGGFSLHAGPAYEDAIKHLNKLAAQEKLKGLLCVVKQQSVADLFHCEKHFQDYHKYKSLIKQLEALK